MTITMLMKNTVRACKVHNNIKINLFTHIPTVCKLTRRGSSHLRVYYFLQGILNGWPDYENLRSLDIRQ